MATGKVNSGAFQGGILSKSIAGAVDVTLTDAEARNTIFNLTGALTGAIAVLIPLVAGQFFFVENRSTGNYACTIKGLTGNGIAVAGNGGNKGALLYFNGTDVIRISADATVTS